MKTPSNSILEDRIDQNDAQNAAPDLRGLGVITAIGAVASAILLVFLAGAYAHWGGAFLARLDVNLGEELMKDGMRLEEAGALDNAQDRYVLALSARFEGPQNRAMTLKRLGALLWQKGQYENALPYLEEAAAGPDTPLSTYEVWCDTLFQLQRFDEMDRALGQWASALSDPPSPDTIAALRFQEGRLALARNDAKTAEAKFLEGTAAVPGGRNASELANIYYADGRFDEAVKFLDQYLDSGATGGRAEYARKLRNRILQRPSS